MEQQRWKSIKVNTNSPNTGFAGGSILNGSPHGSSNSISFNGSGGSPSQTQLIGPAGHNALRAKKLNVDISQPKIPVVTNPRMIPLPTVLASTQPVRDLDLPSHRYTTVSKNPAASQSPVVAKKVDSRADAKASNLEDSFLNSSSGPPQYIGTSYAHLPHSRPSVAAVKLPSRPAVPKPYPVLMSQDFAQTNYLLNNRTMSGKILGNAAQRFINETHVPYLPPEEPLGPDNPYQIVNETWAKCWDAEAGAVYYYNQITGEATWVPPDGL